MRARISCEQVDDKLSNAVGPPSISSKHCRVEVGQGQRFGVRGTSCQTAQGNRAQAKCIDWKAGLEGRLDGILRTGVRVRLSDVSSRERWRAVFAESLEPSAVGGIKREGKRDKKRGQTWRQSGHNQ